MSEDHASYELYRDNHYAFNIYYHNRETGVYYVIMGTTKSVLEERAAYFEQTHDMHCWMRMPDNFCFDDSMLCVRGEIESEQVERETLIQFIYPLSDDSLLCFKGKTVHKICMQTVRNLCEENEEPNPQFPLNKYTICNYLHEYIDVKGSEIKVILERLTSSRSRFYRIRNGITTHYDRDYILHVGLAIELPKVDLIQFMKSVDPVFPSTQIDYKILEYRDRGIMDYWKIRELLIEDLHLEDF